MKKALKCFPLMLLIATFFWCAAASAETSGICGDNATWTLNDDGLLTITGEGEICRGGWVKEEVRSVVIEEGVTSIANNTFYDLQYPQILIPDSVEYFGENIFPDDPRYQGSFICNSIDSKAAKYISTFTNFRPNGSGYHLKYLYEEEEIVGLQINEVDYNVEVLEVPEYVTSIGSLCQERQFMLREVIIPESVVEIDDYAFRECYKLTDITIPESVTRIGQQAFWYCSALEKIILPDNITTIDGYGGDAPFSNCSAKVYANINSITAKSLGKVNCYFRPAGFPYDLLYYYATSTSAEPYGLRLNNVDKDVSSVEVIDDVTWIADHAFENCINLTEIVIPDSVSVIDDYAFANCTSLTEITIPKGVTSIWRGVFSGCANLKKVTFPEKIGGIGYAAFSGCRSLTDIILPENVDSIGNSAFSGCESLQSILIQEKVTSIGSYAFDGCNKLKSITIPSNVTTIGEQAFDRCENLNRVCFLHPDDESLCISFADTLFNSNPTIYCYMFSPVDTWATGKYTVEYLDDITIDDIRTVELPTDFQLANGETRIITAALFPADGSEIVWTSSNQEIVSVENGVVTAAGAGTATVTATVGAVSDSVDITVFVPMTSFEFNKSEYWLEAKDTLQLEPVNIQPEGASAEFTWSISNENYATVDTNGLVTSIRPGDVTITATTERGVSNSCVLHLTYPVTSITIEDLTVHLGMPAAITATAITRNAEYINKLMTFSSSDENIFTVDDEGNITSVSPGTAAITATTTYSGKTATAEVTVVDHVAIIDQEGVEPTCEEPGLSPESHCEICGEILSVQEEIPALGHLWGRTQYERSADKAFVTASHVCERDPSHAESETRHTLREIHEIPQQEVEGSYYLYSGEFANPAFGQVYLGSWPIPALQDMTILTLPADLRVIEEEAFAGISAQAVIIPATVESIGSRAFADSNSLLYVVTYLSPDQIPANAFEGSDSVVIDFRN